MPLSVAPYEVRRSAKGYRHPLRPLGDMASFGARALRPRKAAEARRALDLCDRMLELYTPFDWMPREGAEGQLLSMRAELSAILLSLSGRREGLLALPQGYSLGDHIRNILHPSLQPIVDGPHRLLGAALLASGAPEALGASGTRALRIPLPTRMGGRLSGVTRFLSSDTPVIRADALRAAAAGLTGREALALGRTLDRDKESAVFKDILFVLMNDGMPLAGALDAAKALARTAPTGS